MKKTAVNFLIEQMFVKSGIEVTKENNPDLFELFNQAKAMEKEQIIDSFFSGYNYEGGQLEEKSEQYYNQTFTEQPQQ
jgi:hypothetical protein